MNKLKVLFVCIHNSARSQMAEELLRKYAGDRFEVESAGIEPGTLNPYVVEALKEDGIDISGKKPQSVQQLKDAGKTYDYVIAVCDESAAARCPVFPGKVKQIRWGFRDPSQFSGEDKLAQVREVREEIRAKIQEWIEEAGSGKR